ncbi:MAG: EAL domain-containing protein [Negativicutes bacterium]
MRQTSTITLQVLRTMLDSVYDAIILHDMDGTILDVNNRMLEMFQVEHDEALTLTIGQDYSGPENDIASLPDIWRQVVQGEPMLFEWVARRPHDHSLFDAEIYLCRVKIHNADAILATIRDITARKKTEQALTDSEKKFRKLIQSAPDAMVFVDPQGKIVLVNDQMKKMFGYEEIELKGKTVEKLISLNHIDHAGIRADFFANASAKAMEAGAELLAVHKDEHEFPVAVNLSQIATEDGLVVCVAVRDITENKKNAQQSRLWAEILKNSGEGMFVTDAEANIILTNDAFVRISGYSTEEIIGQKPSLFKSDRHGREFYQIMWDSLLQTGYWQGEIWDRRKDGTVYPKWSTISRIIDDKQKVTHYIAVFNDITDRKEAEGRVRYLALYDNLTGLPNRSLLQDRLQSAIKHASRFKEKLAVIFMDLDNFKTINDSLGYTAGDELLQQVGKRLEDTCRSSDTVSRFGGDEFVILLPSGEHPLHAVHVAERMAQALNRPFDINGFSLKMTASIGICLYPDDGGDVDSLIRNADAAMNNIKENGRGNYRFYSMELNTLAAGRLSLINDLRLTLEQNEFVLHYQPKVNAISGKLTGVEALLRWNHPQKGMIPPLGFIAELEETRLIIPVSEWILKEVCRQQREWVQMGLGQIPVAVNVSAVQFQHPSFLETVKAFMGTCETWQCIEFEVTEGVVLKNPAEAIEIMEKLKDMGLLLSLDDFGTGYSSLSYLRRLPIDKLKIDQSFVQEMMGNPKDIVIIKAILELSKGLKLKTIAEGVETKKQLSVLRSMGCDEVQGYYFAKPMPNEAFVRWLNNGTVLKNHTRTI